MKQMQAFLGGTKLTRIVTQLALLWLALLLLSFSASMFLPDHEGIGDLRTQRCYWTNAMISYVECGAQTIAPKMLALLMNIWWMAFIMPFWHGGFWLLLLAPYIYLLARLLIFALIRNNDWR